jgi:NADP-dependent 3-hydroxy acid dehydrogenase YdfG
VGGARRTERVDADVALELDVTDPASSRRFVEAAVAELGQIDVLVNNAGLALGREPFWESSDDDEETVIATNVLGLMRMTRLCLPHLADWSHIVNLGSVAGIWSYPSGSSYVASKFAVHGYTRAIRDDLQGRPIRVTNVAPGLVETEGFSKTRFRGDEEKAAAVYANVAVGGPLHAEDVVDCILFALTRPKHVNIDEIVVMALAQTSGSNVARTS